MLQVVLGQHKDWSGISLPYPAMINSVEVYNFPQIALEALPKAEAERLPPSDLVACTAPPAPKRVPEGVPFYAPPVDLDRLFILTSFPALEDGQRYDNGQNDQTYDDYAGIDHRGLVLEDRRSNVDRIGDVRDAVNKYSAPVHQPIGTLRARKRHIRCALPQAHLAWCSSSLLCLGRARLLRFASVAHIGHLAVRLHRRPNSEGKFGFILQYVDSQKLVVPCAPRLQI